MIWIVSLDEIAFAEFAVTNAVQSLWILQQSNHLHVQNTTTVLKCKATIKTNMGFGLYYNVSFYRLNCFKIIIMFNNNNNNTNELLGLCKM